MSSLFPIEVDKHDIPDIPGLSYRPDYVSRAEEHDLRAAIDESPWDTSWERRRQPYGSTYGPQDAAVSPIPDWALWLVDRLHRDRIGDRPFDQMLINEYLPGQGIAMHCDYEPFDRIVVSLSLLTPCVMDFRHIASDRRESLLLQPRSLLILSDVARYEWQHGIARRLNDRWHGVKIPRERRLSVTFRLHKSNPAG